MGLHGLGSRCGQAVLPSRGPPGVGGGGRAPLQALPSFQRLHPQSQQQSRPLPGFCCEVSFSHLPFCPPPPLGLYWAQLDNPGSSLCFNSIRYCSFPLPCNLRESHVPRMRTPLGPLFCLRRPSDTFAPHRQYLLSLLLQGSSWNYNIAPSYDA